MIDPADEFGQGGTGITWHLKQSEGRSTTALGTSIVFELVGFQGSTLASFSIPTETIDELLRPHLSLFAELQLDGAVSLDSEIFALLPPPTATDIIELVKEALVPEMLEEEPNLKNQLTELRRKLTEAISLVDQTLADLNKQQT